MLRIHSNTIEESIDTIALLTQYLHTDFNEDFIDAVPAFNTVLIYVNLSHTTPEAFRQNLLYHVAAFSAEAPRLKNPRDIPVTISLPIYYGPELAWDLQSAAGKCGLSGAELIKIHSEQYYHVCAIGFSPGFAYLGFTDPALHLARRSSPRTHVPKGAVAIAENQTAIYPQASPGGWHIIGRCPSTLFEVQESNSTILCVFEVGAKVKFYSVSLEEYIALGGQLDE